MAVFIHCKVPSYFGMAVDAVSRFLVPFFFMISGYYAYSHGIGKFDTWKKIKHIGGITLFASLFYISVSVVRYCVFGGPIDLRLVELLSFLLFNKPPAILPVHLWFLFALLYVYSIYALIVRFNLYRFAYWMIPVLLVIYVIMAQGMYLCGVNVHTMFYRNFLFYGFPFFMLGNWLRQKESLNVNTISLWIIIAVSTVLVLMERLALGRIFSIYIFNIPQVIRTFPMSGTIHLFCAGVLSCALAKPHCQGAASVS